MTGSAALAVIDSAFAEWGDAGIRDTLALGMLGLFLTIGIVALWATFHFIQAKKKELPVAKAPFDKQINCPSCKTSLEMEGMLDSSVFFGAGAIVFDCCHCHDRVYFAPYESHIETGTLGCSPVVDPIPTMSFSYPQGFEMKSNIHDGFLKIQIKEQSWEIPRYGLWNERADIPHPSHAGKTEIPEAPRFSP